MIAIGADHAAYDFKEAIKAHLEQKGYAVKDVGAFSKSVPCDYPDLAKAACAALGDGGCESVILACGTGIGMSIAANKIKGVRCAHCSDTFSARAARQHNDANVLALGERVLGIGLALDIVDIFLATPFSGEERHARRIAKIESGYGADK
jgi:ribose 5-phosphate isomerase B